MDVNANEAFAILMREVRSPVDCLTETSVDHFEAIVLKHLEVCDRLAMLHDDTKDKAIAELQGRVRKLEGCMKAIRGVIKSMPSDNKTWQIDMIVNQSVTP